MTSLTRNDLKLAEEAAEWLTRRMYDSSKECREGLVTWLQRSPRHVEEFLLAQTTFGALHGFDPQRQIDVQELVASAKASIVPPRQIGLDPDRQPTAVEPTTQKSRIRQSAIAVGALAIVAVLVLGCWQYFGNLDNRTYSTGLGEQRIIRLSDGSLIELNTRSEATVNFSKDTREVRLLKGEALFVVAHDRFRPFRVTTKSAIIHALGTRFDVYLGETSTRVAVVDGRIRVASDEPHSALSIPVGSTWMGSSDPPSQPTVVPTLLVAGEQASVTGDGQVTKVVEPNVSNAIAWRKGQLVFDHTSLSEVVKELSRYSDFHIDLVGDELRDRHISGVFQTDDPQTIVALLENDITVKVQHVDNGVIITPRD